jgi:DNA-binding transcriptional LysR family regulator
VKGSRDSLKALRIFLVAARTLNFSRSGEELHLTQSAVSKNISALEERLGTSLFKRTPTGLRLTYAGTLYLERVSPALHLIDEADAVVGHRGARAALNIAVSPSFAQFCLIPNLRDFFERHPDIQVNIRPRLMFEYDESERFDAAIQLHTGYAQGMSCEYLCGEEMALIASPSLLAKHALDTIADLDRTPLLKRAQRGYSWNEWKTDIAPSWAGPAATAPVYEGFSILLPAIFNGLGISVAPLCMVIDRLNSGELQRPLGEIARGRYAYYLMRPRPAVNNPALDAFCSWLDGRIGRLNADIHTLRLQ